MERANTNLTEVINNFIKIREDYQNYCSILEDILRYIVSGISSEYFIQSRIKSVLSFFKKFVERKPKYDDPLKDITDICGIRIVLPNKDEESLVCKIIEDNFLIDYENSVDKFEEQKDYEFRYNAIHYIIQLNPASIIMKMLNIPIPE